MKNLHDRVRSRGASSLSDEELLALLKKDYKSLTKFYTYLHEAAIKFNSENIK